MQLAMTDLRVYHTLDSIYQKKKTHNKHDFELRFYKYLPTSEKEKEIANSKSFEFTIFPRCEKS